MKQKENPEYIRHSLAHLLAAAVLKHYPDALPTIGPAVENGFYYDFEFSTPIGDGDLPKIEKEMRAILKTWTSFEKKVVSKEDALKYFKTNPYKRELIEEIASEGQEITLYTSGDFTDLCRGGHVENAQNIDPRAFTLSRVAGAYWRGDENNKMLTRIYGFAFETEEELSSYLDQLEEAKKRDHKKLGKEQDLFVFSDLVGSGLPLWTPKGTVIRNLLDDFVWELRREYGYMKVEIPHITKKDLYQTSGHWEKFKDELFLIVTREGHEFALKPMNCPHHTQIYARKQWSYRELPQRYANSTMCYRDEQTGELSGLSRVRSFTQDDAHVFCRASQVKEEFLNVWNVIHDFYGAFGFDLRIRISTHDPENPSNYLGDKELWKKAEDELRSIVAEKEVEAIEGVGEAAFYGPKLDFIAKDSIGREWQVATIQLDMNLPERFDLFCINEQGEKERIVMIHCAIMGSIERFMSVLIEHCAGVFPTWLSPVQVRVLPIGENHRKYAREAYECLNGNGFRVELDDSDISLGKKVRQAKIERIPYWIVIGDKEVESEKVTIEHREKGNIGAMDIEDFDILLKKEVADKK